MKLLLGVLLAAAYSVPCVACASPPKQQIVLSKPGEIHQRNEPVALTLTNKKDESIRVYANVEVMDETGDWVTWSFRLEDGNPDAIAIIYKLGPGESKTLTFDVRNAVPPPVPAGETAPMAERLNFRFRVVALDPTYRDIRNEQFSEPFVIEHPYGRRAARIRP